jgi:hypothetical protein
MFSKRLDNPSKGLDFPSEAQPIETRMPECTLDEMQQIVRAAAQPYEPGEGIKAAINRSARRLGLNFRRARAYWYGEVRLVPADEADRLRAARVDVARDRARELAALIRECRETADDINDILDSCRATTD